MLIMGKTKKTMMGVSLSPQLVKKIDEIVKRLSLRSRSEMLEFLISRYLPDPEDQEMLENLAIEIARWRLAQAKEKNEKKKKSIILLNDENKY